MLTATFLHLLIRFQSLFLTLLNGLCHALLRCLVNFCEPGCVNRANLDLLDGPFQLQRRLLALLTVSACLREMFCYALRISGCDMRLLFFSVSPSLMFTSLIFTSAYAPLDDGYCVPP